MKKPVAFLLSLLMFVTSVSVPAIAVDSEVVLSANSIITAPNGTANALDGNLSTFFYFGDYVGDITETTSNNVIELDLGNVHNVSNFTINWGCNYADGEYHWGMIHPNAYTVYTAGDDGVYTQKLTYTDLYTSLPASMTTDNANYYPDAKVDAVESVEWSAVRYIKIVIDEYQYVTAIREISIFGEEIVAPQVITDVSATSTLPAFTNEWGEELVADRITDGENGKTMTGWLRYCTADTIGPGDGTSVLYSLGFDLGSKYDVTEMFMRWANGQMLDGVLYASVDGTDWTAIHTFSNQTYTFETEYWSNYNTVEIECDDYYRYLKLDITKISGNVQSSIFEISFEGNPAPSAPAGTVKLDLSNITYTDGGTGHIQTGNTVSAIVDGNTDTALGFTSWYNDANQIGTFDIDLGALFDVTEFDILWGTPASINEGYNWAAPASYTVQVAGEDQRFFTVYTYSGSKTQNQRQDRVTAFANSYALDAVRYIKIVFDCSDPTVAPSVTQSLGISELTVYGYDTIISPLKAKVGDNSAELKFNVSVDKTNVPTESDINFGMILLPEAQLGNYATLRDYVVSGGSDKTALSDVSATVETDNDLRFTYSSVYTFANSNNAREIYNTRICALPYMETNGTRRYFEEITSSIAQAAYFSVNNGNNTAALEAIVNTALYASNGYYDIQAAKAVGAGDGTDSSLFISGVAGYEINGDYVVDADTLRMLGTANVSGNGNISYENYTNFTQYIANAEYGEGYGPDYYGEQIVSAPVSKLNDPVYMSMVLPSEGLTYMGEERTNGNNMHAASDKYYNATPIGALYKNANMTLPDDAQVTVCISNMKLLMRTTTSNGWFNAITTPALTADHMGLYFLPWELEGTLGGNVVTAVNPNRITTYPDHIEITLYGSDFNYTNDEIGVDERVLHFWGDRYNFDCDGSDVLGVVSGYKIWIKEEQWAPYFVASIGVDWRLSNNSTRQAFAGFKYAVTTSERLVFGHNVGPTAYDAVMDTQTVQNLLGMN